MYFEKTLGLRTPAIKGMRDARCRRISCGGRREYCMLKTQQSGEREEALHLTIRLQFFKRTLSSHLLRRRSRYSPRWVHPLCNISSLNCCPSSTSQFELKPNGWGKCQTASVDETIKNIGTMLLCDDRGWKSETRGDTTQKSWEYLRPYFWSGNPRAYIGVMWILTRLCGICSFAKTPLTSPRNCCLSTSGIAFEIKCTALQHIT